MRASITTVFPGVLSGVLCGAVVGACSATSGEATRSVASASVASASGPFAYAYDAVGLPAAPAGATASFDALGRVVARGDATFAYGADGQLAHAQAGGHAADFVDDEDGERLFELRDGAPMRATVDGLVVDARGLTEPLDVAGHVVGVVRGGALSTIATDARASVVAGGDGVVDLPSPYGDRASHPDVTAAIDYAASGWNDVVGAIRMGVRDYDPRLARFLTPDPLFLEHPERCADSPVECNLYGYAQNRPLDLVDPAGTEAQEAEPTPPESSMSLDDMLGKGEPTSREEMMSLAGVETARGVFSPTDEIEYRLGGPGTPQPTRDAAGYAALNFYSTRSIYGNREYAGLVYQNPDHSYSFTPAARGFVDHSYPENTQDHVPRGAKVTAYFHTHGGPDPRYEGERFSGDDATLAKDLQIAAYVVTPTHHYGVLEPLLPRSPTNAVGTVYHPSTRSTGGTP
jgi:RHS repeat-associated protein